LTQKYLEKYLHKEYSSCIKKLLKTARAKVKGKRKTGIDPKMHRDLAPILKVLEMSPEETAIESAEALMGIEIAYGHSVSGREKDTNDVESAEVAEFKDDEFSKAMDRFSAVDLFGNIGGADVKDLVRAYEELDDIIEPGRKRGIARRKAVAEELDEKRQNAVRDVTGGEGILGSVGEDKMIIEREKRIFRQGWYNWMHLRLSSFEWLMNAVTRKDPTSMTLKSPTGLEMSILVHRATQSKNHQDQLDYELFHNKFNEVFGHLKAFFKPIGTKGAEKGAILYTKRAVIMVLQKKKIEKSGVFRREGMVRKKVSIPFKHAQNSERLKALGVTDPAALEEIEIELARRSMTERPSEAVVKVGIVEDPGKLEEHPMSQDDAMQLTGMPKDSPARTCPV